MLDLFVFYCRPNASEDTESRLVGETFVIWLWILVEDHHDAFHVCLEDLIVLFLPDELLSELSASLFDFAAFSFGKRMDVFIEEFLKVNGLGYSVLTSLVLWVLLDVHKENLYEMHSVEEEF